jgi:iron(III) transport system ATP-binding protein
VQPLIIRSLKKHFGEKIVIKDLNLEIHPSNGLWCLVGENGSGKSTLLKLIAGLVDFDAGSIYFNGRKIKSPSEQLIAGNKSVVYVQQEPELMPKHTIAENLEYSLRTHEITYREERMAFLKSFFELTPILHKLPAQCSGGERQRAALACALSDETQLLLFDEPFNALDLPMRAELKRIIYKLIEWNECMIVLVTHNPDDIIAFAGQLTVVREGEVCQHGDFDEVYHNPKDAYVAQLLGYDNILPSEWVRNYQPSLSDYLQLTKDGLHYYGLSANVGIERAMDGAFTVLHSSKTAKGFLYTLEATNSYRLYASSTEFIEKGIRVNINHT